MKRTAEDSPGPTKRARPTDPANPDPRHESSWAPGLSTAFYGGLGGFSAAPHCSAAGYNPYAPTYAGYSGGGIESLGFEQDSFSTTGLNGNVGAGYAPGFNSHLVVNTSSGSGFGSTSTPSSTSVSASASASASPTPLESSASNSFTLLTPDAQTETYGFPSAMGHDTRMEMGLCDEDAMMDDSEPCVSAAQPSAPPPSPVRARAHTVPSNPNPTHAWTPSAPDHPLAHAHAHAHGRGYHAYSASLGGGGQGAHPGCNQSAVSAESQSQGYGYGHGHALREPRPLQPRYPPRPAATPLQPPRAEDVGGDGRW